VKPEVSDVQPLDPILSQLNPSIPSYTISIKSNLITSSHLRLTSERPKFCMHFSYRHACYMPRPSGSWTLYNLKLLVHTC